jgi:hypothetical protein
MSISHQLTGQEKIKKKKKKKKEKDYSQKLQKMRLFFKSIVIGIPVTVTFLDFVGYVARVEGGTLFFPS